MILKSSENLFNSVTVTSAGIEAQICKFSLTFSQTRNGKTEWRLKLPVFTRSFHKYIKAKNSVPSQNDYWIFYTCENKEYLSGLNLSQEEKTGVKARVFRAYPSLVRDFHFGLYIKEKNIFKTVFYNEILDIEYGIDLVVENAAGEKTGLIFFTKTKAAEHARNVKKLRPKKKAGFVCHEIPIDFCGSKVCGDFFLYSEREINTIMEKISPGQFPPVFSSWKGPFPL